MRVFKFGGASVRDAGAIRNLGRIVADEELPLIVVVSAFGKTTNALEEVINAKYKSRADSLALLEALYEKHLGVVKDLGLADTGMDLFLVNVFERLKKYLIDSPASDYDRDYDQVVSAGELWSSRIIASYLNREVHKCEWIDIRDVLLTDNRFRDATVLWHESEERVRSVFGSGARSLFLTQGFIGGTHDGQCTTLGREGSDYTAAILANMLDASEVQVWKDVPGIMNADPKWLDDAVALEYLSYREAVEMSFSGAKVIHPKTIKPLHNKKIPLIVRSFIETGIRGTIIAADEPGDMDMPVYIRKEDQILISILSRDFSFAIGDNIAHILAAFYEYGISANMVQASAVAIAVCADDDGRRIRRLISRLENDYKVIYNTGLELLTIRGYTAEAIQKVCGGREMLVEQKTRRTVRFVVKAD